MTSINKNKKIYITLFVLSLLALIVAIICIIVGRNTESQVKYKNLGMQGAAFSAFIALIFGKVIVPEGPSLEDQLLIIRYETCFGVGIGLIYLAALLFVIGIVVRYNGQKYVRIDSRGFYSFEQKLIRVR